MYFYISCSLWWSPAALTTEKRSATWFMCDKKCSEQFLQPEANIIWIFIVSCVYWYEIFAKFVRISKLFEPLNIKVLIESGAGLLVQLSDKCASRNRPRFRIKPKNVGFRPIYYQCILSSACFDIFSNPLCCFKSTWKPFGKVSIKRPSGRDAISSCYFRRRKICSLNENC